MDHRRLLSLIGDCAFDCSKRRPGLFFCDPNTGNCEPCIDICHPSRGTLDECREQNSCKDLWNTLASTELDGVAPMTSAYESASNDLLLLTATPILVFICALALTILAVVFIRRKLRARAEIQRAGGYIVYKPPIPVSNIEQERERLRTAMEDAAADAAAEHENCICIGIPPEVGEGRLPLISA